VKFKDLITLFMKTYRNFSIVIFSFCYLTFSAQSKAIREKEKNLLGQYIGLEKCSISSWQIILKKSHKAVFKTSGHYNIKNSNVGKWLLKSDTLSIRFKKKETLYFLIKDTLLCHIKKDNELCENFCLIKQ